MPGTDTKVTPEMGAPIMAMATMNHGASRPPVRAAWSSLRRDAAQEIRNSNTK